VPVDKTIDLAAMTGRQKGNDGPEKGRAPVSIGTWWGKQKTHCTARMLSLMIFISECGTWTSQH
jgi:hypothetical protein